MTAPGESTAFYPAAWHAMVTLAVQGTGAPVEVATSATAVVVAVLVCPLAAVALARAVLGRRPVALAATGALASVVLAQPLTLIAFGVAAFPRPTWTSSSGAPPPATRPPGRR